MEKDIFDIVFKSEIIGKLYDPIDSKLKFIIQNEFGKNIWRGIFNADFIKPKKFIEVINNFIQFFAY